jgi:hypothetical protein
VTEFCEREKYEAKGAKLLLDKVTSYGWRRGPQTYITWRKFRGFNERNIKILLSKFGTERDVTKYIKKVFINLYYTCWNSC